MNAGFDPSRDDMVYRVASAIARSNILAAEPKTGRLSDAGIDQLVEHFSTKCIPEARAAIAAMREPTEAMIDAAAATPGMKAASDTMVLHQARGYGFDADAFKAGSPLHQAWRAMIDAASVDRSGEAGETPQSGSTEGESAVPERHSPTPSPTSSTTAESRS